MKWLSARRAVKTSEAHYDALNVFVGNVYAYAMAISLDQQDLASDAQVFVMCHGAEELVDSVWWGIALAVFP